MTEVVGRELDFEAVGSQVARRVRHDAGVVDEYVELAVGLGQEFLGPFPDGGEGGVVHLDELNVAWPEDGRQGGPGFGKVAGCEEAVGAVRGHGKRSLDADSRRGSGDEDDFAGELSDQVFILDDLQSGGAGVTGTLGET